MIYDSSNELSENDNSTLSSTVELLSVFTADLGALINEHDKISYEDLKGIFDNVEMALQMGEQQGLLARLQRLRSQFDLDGTGKNQSSGGLSTVQTNSCVSHDKAKSILAWLQRLASLVEVEPAPVVFEPEKKQTSAATPIREEVSHVEQFNKGEATSQVETTNQVELHDQIGSLNQVETTGQDEAISQRTIEAYEELEVAESNEKDLTPEEVSFDAENHTSELCETALSEEPLEHDPDLVSFESEAIEEVEADSTIQLNEFPTESIEADEQHIESSDMDEAIFMQEVDDKDAPVVQEEGDLTAEKWEEALAGCTEAEKALLSLPEITEETDIAEEDTLDSESWDESESHIDFQESDEAENSLSPQLKELVDTLWHEIAELLPEFENYLNSVSSSVKNRARYCEMLDTLSETCAYVGLNGLQQFFALLVFRVQDQDTLEPAQIQLIGQWPELVKTYLESNASEDGCLDLLQLLDNEIWGKPLEENCQHDLITFLVEFVSGRRSIRRV